MLYDHAVKILREKWYSQVLVYAPAGNAHFQKRYKSLDMQKWGDYTCYWSDI
jgi:hypothetical protein